MAKNTICSVEDCGKPVQSLGYCCAHYLRFRRHGAPLGGRSYNGQPRTKLAEALVYDGRDCLIWQAARNNKGYAVIRKNGAARLVSRLICEELNGPPEGLKVAAHACNNGHLGCVNPKHISWKTHRENSEDSRIAGTMVIGEKHARAVLTEKDVLEIKAMIGKITNIEIGKMYGVNSRHISRIKLGQRWKHLT